MKLSILIATIFDRISDFKLIYSELVQQREGDQEIEILFYRDNRQLSIGDKRNNLISQAAGDYVVFIDDDDWIPSYYIKEIIKAIEVNPDSIGFLQHCIFNGAEEKMACLSNKYSDWAENLDGYDYVRTPYHKTPIRRDIALNIGFKNMRYAEDHDFSKRLKSTGLIKNEYFIDKIMYYYRYSNKVSHNEKYGITY